MKTREDYKEMFPSWSDAQVDDWVARQILTDEQLAAEKRRKLEVLRARGAALLDQSEEVVDGKLRDITTGPTLDTATAELRYWTRELYPDLPEFYYVDAVGWPRIEIDDDERLTPKMRRANPRVSSDWEMGDA